MNESQYNTLVEQARALGLTRFRPIKRFKPASSGAERITQIEEAIRAAQAGGTPAPSEAVGVPIAEEIATVSGAVAEVHQQEDTPMAKAAKKAKAPKTAKAPKKAAAEKKSAVKRGRPPTNGETIAAKTKAYNDLVPAAKKKGVAWAKEHTSFFGSHTAADAQLKRIQDAIKAA